MPKSIPHIARPGGQTPAQQAADRDRANHTGTQGISTVDGLQEALDDKLSAPGNTIAGDFTINGSGRSPLEVWRPANVWHVKVGVDGGKQLRFAGNDTQGGLFGCYHGNGNNNPIDMRMQRDGGNLGIGNVVPTEKLHVDGKIKATDINFTNLPTSATGLSAGDVWNDGGTLKIVS